MKRKIATLFKDLCCSVCKTDFNENSVAIMREEKTKGEEMLVCRISCPNCGKSFGVAFLGLSDINLKNYTEADLTLKIQEGSPPIDADEVINAHEFIKEIDKNWQKFISDLDSSN